VKTAPLTEADLVRWGERVGARVEPPVFFALRGPLGAGKSVLARAIARGAGVEAVMPSPTFNLLFRYAGTDGRSVVHMDLYRITDPDELTELGWEELGGDRELDLVEWAERAGERLPPDYWDVRLTPIPGKPELRVVGLEPVGTPPPLPDPQD
jgi:tRNA threonylcarbamoyl adenosine modification protein YjeE